MARTSVDEVKEILTTSLTDSAIDKYVDMANVIVTQNLESTDLGVAALSEIERWLAAHLIAITKELQPKSEKLGESSITYTGNFGEGLKSTHYGQMAAMLDTSGTLLAMGRKKMVLRAVKSFT